jgi:hypothetical protein
MSYTLLNWFTYQNPLGDLELSENKKRNAVILCILPIVAFLFSLYWETLFPDEDVVIVPFLQMETFTYFIFIGFLIPVIGGIISAIILPRILVPLFLATKGVVWRDFQNGYVETGQDVYSLRRWFSRSLLIALLVLGLIAAIISSIDPLLFITQDQYTEFTDLFGTAQYLPPITMSLAGLLSPIALGIWATSWAMEDAGLVHYKIPKEGEAGFYEVEPVHVRFSSYVKGYAGISSLIFIITIFLIMISDLDNAFFTLLMPLYAIVQTIPGYLVYSALNKKYLRKGLSMIRRISEEDLRDSQSI